MKAFELQAYLKSLVTNIPAKSVDRIICGDPESEVKAIATAWMPYRETIEKAHALGANVMVVHEPTFYDHWDLDGGMKGNPLSVKKLKMIKDSAITIIRCHDVWDVMPEHGIPFAWAKFLDLGIPVKSNVYYHICKIKPQSAEAFCRHVASKTAKIGQPVVGFYGDGDTEIENVGIGTGCACEPFILYEMGADIVISIDDTVRTWIECEWSHDCGKPLIVVNHGVSEEPGIVSLAEFIKKKFPEIPVTHIPQGSTYKAVGAREF